MFFSFSSLRFSPFRVTLLFCIGKKERKIQKAPSLFVKGRGIKPVLPPLFTVSSRFLPQQVQPASQLIPREIPAILRHDNVCRFRHSLLIAVSQTTRVLFVRCEAPGGIRHSSVRAPLICRLLSVRLSGILLVPFVASAYECLQNKHLQLTL